MTTLDDWGVPLAVLGMLLATLFMAAVLKRYQEHQALVRARVRRLEAGISDATESLSDLRGVPLSRELRVTLRTDVVTRYRAIQRLYRRYPGIGQRIQQAEDAANAEGAPPATGVGPIDDEQAFRKIIHALDRLDGILGAGSTVQPIPADVRDIFRREVGERRAEANARFHLVASAKYQRNEDWIRARSHLTTLMQILRKRGPSTEFVRELYAEAQAALDNLAKRQAVPLINEPGEAPAAQQAG